MDQRHIQDSVPKTHFENKESKPFAEDPAYGDRDREDDASGPDANAFNQSREVRETVNDAAGCENKCDNGDDKVEDLYDPVEGAVPVVFGEDGNANERQHSVEAL